MDQNKIVDDDFFEEKMRCESHKSDREIAHHYGKTAEDALHARKIFCSSAEVVVIFVFHAFPVESGCSKYWSDIAAITPHVAG